MVPWSKKWDEGNDIIAPKEIILNSYETADLPADAKDGTLAYDKGNMCFAVKFNSGWACVNNSWFNYNKYSMLLDGTNEYINCGNDSSIEFDGYTDAFSYSCWVKPTSPLGWDGLISKRVGSAARNGIMLGVDAFNWVVIHISKDINNAKEIKVRTQDVKIDNTSKWYHIVVTYDGSANASGVNIYIDGASTTRQTQRNTLDGSTSNTENLLIGYGRSSYQYTPAKIDEVSIWNKELSSSDVTEIFNSGVPGNLLNHTSAANLQAWWKMGESATWDGNNWSIPDDSTNSNTGTSVNMEQADRVQDTP